MSSGNILEVGNLTMATGKEQDSIFLSLIYDHRHFIFIFLLAIATFIAISNVRRFCGLRHFQGPPLAAWSKLWLLKTVTSRRMHQIFYTTTKKYGWMVRIAPNSLMTSDATLWRRICAVRSPYVRADWYKGMRLEPDKDVIRTYSNDKHTEMRSKMATGYAGKGSENLEKDIDARITELLKLIGNKYISDDHSYKPLDWGLMSSSLTLDVVTELGFIHILMAGTDLAATTLRVAILYILTQPQAHMRLLDEFRAHRLLSGRSIETIVSIATASNMPYLQACIKETLRICPPFCGLLEKVVPHGGDVISDGRILPKGTHIGPSFWGIMRDTDVFGDDADVFRLERWVNTEKETLRVMERSAECGFSSGRYTCLGKDMAILQVNKVIVEVSIHI
ncbi:unnamed protein product [Fusarium graminearum]|nr:unnamed protein product [Fusarium graminearum]